VTIYRITAPHFTASIEVEGDICKRAEHSADYMEGKTIWWIMRHCAILDWSIEEITPPGPNNLQPGGRE